MTSSIILFYILFPAVLLHLCRRYPLINKIGPVILAYFFGILLGNSSVLPAKFAETQDLLSSVSVALALPLLLFSLDVKSWLHFAGKAIISMLGATILVVFVSALGSWFVQSGVPDSWKFGGMAIGLYTGGTPNLAAIKVALDVEPTQFIMMHTYDAVNGIIYLLFVMSIGQRVFNRFLIPYQQIDDLEPETEVYNDGDEYRGIFKPRILKKLSLAFLLSILIVGLSLGLAGLIPESYSTAAVMLLITSLAIAASFNSQIRTLPMTFQFGMYIILIFSLVVGSMANLKQLVQINWSMMFFVNFVVFGTMALHAIFCRLSCRVTRSLNH